MCFFVSGERAGVEAGNEGYINRGRGREIHISRAAVARETSGVGAGKLPRGGVLTGTLISPRHWERGWKLGLTQPKNAIYPALFSAGFRPGNAQRVEMLLLLV